MMSLYKAKVPCCKRRYKKRERIMIQSGTFLEVADNSGGRIVQCVKVLQKTKGRYGGVGDIIIVSVKSLVRNQKSKVKKGHLYKAVILETRKGTSRVDGSACAYSRNTVTLLSANGGSIGSRITGLTPYELRAKNHTKLISLSARNV
jgi:large subunit ribosomal protein L14